MKTTIKKWIVISILMISGAIIQIIGVLVSKSAFLISKDSEDDAGERH